MKLARRLLVFAAAFAAAVAQAHYGFTTRDANVRAGPAREYPLVAWLPVGTVVELVGCIADWRWCEIATGPVRGFVYAGFLGFPHEGGYVIVRDGGPYLGLAIVGFALESYWGTWYQDRPWYRHGSSWPNHAPPRPPAARPPHRPPAVHPLPPGHPGRPGSGGIVPPMTLTIPPITRPVEPFTAPRPSPPSRSLPDQPQERKPR